MLDATAARRHPGTMIYKILRLPEWQALCHHGATRGAPVDRADGYIHFSTAAQLAETAAKHFAGAADLMILAVDDTRLGPDLRWEPSRGGALFPHLYRPLRLADAAWARPAGPDGALPDLTAPDLAATDVAAPDPKSPGAAP